MLKKFGFAFRRARIASPERFDSTAIWIDKIPFLSGNSAAFSFASKNAKNGGFAQLLSDRLMKWK